MTDEETFDRVFGRADWAMMFILANGGQSFARLRYNVGPRAEFEIPVSVDFTRPFGGCNHDAWKREYLANVQPQQPIRKASPASEPAVASPFYEGPLDEWRESWFDYAEDEGNVKGALT